MTQEHKPTGRDRVVQRVLITAGMIVGAFLLVGVMPLPLYAQPYPNKPIRYILPMATGGATDILGRIVGQKLAERLGPPVVPENRGGSGGNIGIETAAKARPDGYTILFGQSSLGISPSLYKTLNYDPIKDFAPISLVAQTHFVVVVRPSLSVKNLKELVEYARANPGKLNFGSTGIGAMAHLSGELLKSLSKVDIVHVPYKGGGQAVIGLMGGEVDMLVMGTASVLPQVHAGKLRALAVLSKGRVPSLPDVPTSKEAGIENYEVNGWYGILVPVGTPREIVNRLNAEWSKIAAMSDTMEKMKDFGVDPISSTPERFSEFLKAEVARWSKVIKEANIPRID